jgi:large subunit ribosomal protein L23
MSTAPKTDAPKKAPKAAPAKAAAAPANAPAETTAKPVRTAAARPARKAAPKAARPAHSEARLSQVLVGPIVSEKATMVSEKRNQVTFKVLRDATKPEIKAAVELLFKVEVASVQTAVQKGKSKKFGRSMGRRDHVKKAYVGLKAGQELNFSGEGA